MLADCCQGEIREAEGAGLAVTVPPPQPPPPVAVGMGVDGLLWQHEKMLLQQLVKNQHID